VKSIIFAAIFSLMFSSQAGAEIYEGLTAFEDNSMSSMPSELRALIKKQKLDLKYTPVYGEVNPYYLCGDFDGDKIRDYAVILKLIKTDKKENFGKIAILMGNGKFTWLDDDIKGGYPGSAWVIFYRDEKVYDRPDINGGIPHPKLNGDGIVLARPESSAALIYWDGKKFSIYWLSD